MPATDNQTFSSNSKIEIPAEWRAHLGAEMLLTQAQPRRGFETGLRFAMGLPNDGLIPAVDNPMPFLQPGSISGDRLEWTLVDAQHPLYVKEAGLLASYGIFGAPRSGKTHLLLYLLRQLLALSHDGETKLGGLILDPKAALIDDVSDMMRAAGRIDDLIVINTDELTKSDDKAVNIIDVALSPSELGRALVLAAQSAGANASEGFWFTAWSNLFSAALMLMDWIGGEIPTLQALAEATLLCSDVDSGRGAKRRIQILAKEAYRRRAELNESEWDDMEKWLNQIDGFYRQEPDNLATIETLITQAYGGFMHSRWKCYSHRQAKAMRHIRPCFYDRIIDEGKVVLVSVSPFDPGMAKVIATLVKVLFQHTVLGRSARVRAGASLGNKRVCPESKRLPLKNFKRPVLLACDEYSDIATEVPGQSMGDGYFFSQARQNGCMGLLATQSVNMLQSSALKDNWRAVFSNFGAKFFMRLVDNESAEEASKLVGEQDWQLTSLGTSQQRDGMGSSTQQELRERKGLPTHILTQVLTTGQAVVLGSLDGGSTTGRYFIKVPSNRSNTQ
jgi:hypothetical protein